MYSSARSNCSRVLRSRQVLATALPEAAAVMACVHAKDYNDVPRCEFRLK
jgi:hypothetical protein